MAGDAGYPAGLCGIYFDFAGSRGNGGGQPLLREDQSRGLGGDGCLGDFFSSQSLRPDGALLSDGLPAQILQTAILLAEEILFFCVTWQMASGIRDMEYYYGTWMNAEDVTVAWKLMVGIYAVGFVFSRLAVLLIAPLNLLATIFLILLTIGNLVFNIFFLVQFYKAKKAYDMLPG